jgi:hypothetical protein
MRAAMVDALLSPLNLLLKWVSICSRTKVTIGWQAWL